MSRDARISTLLYGGLLALAIGGLSLLWPLRWLGVGTRSTALFVLGAGGLLVLVAVLLPAPERRVSTPSTRLDEFVPVWEFAERHATAVAAPCADVFAAMKAVTAAEIRCFRLLTWIRQPRLSERAARESILAPPAAQPILEVALRGGFVLLAEEPADANACRLSTETRVHATGTRARRRFAVYWRLIYPGSALIRRQWLAAISRRAAGRESEAP